MADMKDVRKRSSEVVVLMSCYNGARYVREQIESIVTQLQAGDQLLIRDDGSTDMTPEIINRIASPHIKLILGENLGFARSFLWLLHHVEPKYKIYMLADQDDIWHQDKIDRAFKFVHDKSPPTLYCTRLRLVDELLQPLGMSPKFNRPPEFWNAICENIATGCTIALNQSALLTIRQKSWENFETNQIAYHDWWLYLVISRFGVVHFDPEPSMDYRQHGSNSIGMGAGPRRYLTIWRAVNKKSWTAILVRQLRFFCLLYHEQIDAQDVHELQLLSQGPSWQIAWHLITSKRLRRQNAGGLIIFRTLVLYDALRRRIP